MSLRTKTRQRISQFRDRAQVNQTLRDKMAAPRSASSAVRLMRDALEQATAPEQRAEIERRIALVERATASLDLQAEELKKCATSVEYFFDNYAWTYDPRVDGNKYMPFSLFPIQRKFLKWIQDRMANRQEGVVEKSRDAGASWLVMMFLMHQWLFVPGFKGGVGSRKEVYVDKIGDPDSLFEKIRLAMRMLPEWMHPRGFREKLHFAHMKIVNPQNGSAITGEAGDNIGRGGRATVYVIDESAFIARPDKVEAALSRTSEVKIHVSTPNGMGNVFYRKRHGGAYPVFTFHWRNDPRYNGWVVVPNSWEWELDSEKRVIQPGNDIVINRGHGDGPKEVPDGYKVQYPWYEWQRIKYKDDPIVIAQEIDIDYAASQEAVTIPAIWVRAAVNLNLPYEEHDIRGAMDVADGGGAKNVLVIRQGPMVKNVFHWTKGNSTRSGWRAINLCDQYGATEFVYDSAGGYGSGIYNALLDTERPVHQNVKGINVGGECTHTVWEDDRTSKQRFANLKAELWWRLRRRFEKTYEFVHEGIWHPPEELISIPDHPELITQLSTVQHWPGEDGKVKIETKQQLRTRQVASPDFADALVLSECPVATFDVVAGGVASGITVSGSVLTVSATSGAVANVVRDRRVEDY